MKIFALLLALPLLATGCVTPVSTVASHTIETAPDTDQDVVWLMVGDSLQRCTAVKDEPVCKRVPLEK